ncbi:MAG TPA: peptide MFS transporter [Candidatus Polarisedimenticolaceae bacterium]|nr:peptide MFS transporter [Candidatus Polarisedimenticolaceae bacterium]
MTTDPAKREFLGHPIGIYILFLTEMWERFSYYGMRAIFILYMTNFLLKDDKWAGGIYGDYTGLVYLTPLLGGFLSDRYLGMQRAILLGCLTMAAGQFCLGLHGYDTPGPAAAESLGLFWMGLILLILGNGFFKPNMSALVGQLYEPGDPRRDGGYTIFYMGVNVGAFISPLVCGYFAQKVSWNLGFVAAGVGMLIGWVTFFFGRRLLGGRGAEPAAKVAAVQRAETPMGANEKRNLSIIAALAMLVAGWFGYRGYVATGSVIEAIRGLLWPVIFFICVGMYVFLRGRCTKEEMRKVNVIFILAMFVVSFWSAFEQAGSSMTLFADRDTANSFLGYEFPSSWYQSVNPIFIISLAPLFASLWTWLARKRLEPPTPYKMAIGIGLNALAFFWILPGAMLAASGKVSPMWLVVLYFLQTCGELCLAPVGLSMVSKLAPARYASVLMGVWYLANAWANKLAGVGGSYVEQIGPSRMFGGIGIALAVVAGLLVLVTPRLRREMGGVH